MSREFVLAFFLNLPQIEKFSLADSVDSSQSPVLLEAGPLDRSNRGKDSFYASVGSSV